MFIRMRDSTFLKVKLNELGWESYITKLQYRNCSKDGFALQLIIKGDPVHNPIFIENKALINPLLGQLGLNYIRNPTEKPYNAFKKLKKLNVNEFILDTFDEPQLVLELYAGYKETILSIFLNRCIHLHLTYGTTYRICKNPNTNKKEHQCRLKIVDSSIFVFGYGENRTEAKLEACRLILLRLDCPDIPTGQEDYSNNGEYLIPSKKRKLEELKKDSGNFE